MPGAVERRAAGQHARAARDGVGHLRRQRLDEVGSRHRAELRRRIQRIADPQRGHRRDEPLGELVGDRRGHDEPLGGDARLAAVERARLDGGGHRLRQIGRGHDDERIAAAELEHALLQRAAGAARDVASGAIAAGQRHRRDAIVSRMAGTCSTSIKQRLEHALREPGADEHSSIASAHCGTFGACLRSATLPAISAGAAKRNTCQNGKFQGMIAKTAPIGS